MLEQTEDDRRHHETVDVTYNGIDKKVAIRPHEQMERLLHQALDAFSIHENRHLMALWTLDNRELPITGTVAEAGVVECEVLVLRPSAVRGG